MSILSQLILALMVGIISMPLLLPPGTLMVKSKRDPISTDRNQKTKDKIRYFIGLSMIIGIIFTTNFFINVFAASFGKELGNKWIYCMIYSCLEDFFILQTIKCLIILLCTSEGAISKFLECCIGNGI